MQFSLGFLAGAATMWAILWLLVDVARRIDSGVREALDSLYMELS